MCTNFEEALDVYDRNREHIMGVITDMGFPKDGVHVKTAGLEFTAYVKAQQPEPKRTKPATTFVPRTVKRPAGKPAPKPAATAAASPAAAAAAPAPPTSSTSSAPPPAAALPEGS